MEFIKIRTNLTKKCGNDLNKSGVLEYILHWVQQNKKNNTNLYESKYWMYHTYAQISEDIGISVQKVRTIVNYLRKSKLVQVSQPWKKEGKMTYWYTITPEGYSLINSCDSQLSPIVDNPTLSEEINKRHKLKLSLPLIHNKTNTKENSKRNPILRIEFPTPASTPPKPGLPYVPTALNQETDYTSPAIETKLSLNQANQNTEYITDPTLPPDVSPKGNSKTPPTPPKLTNSSKLVKLTDEELELTTLIEVWNEGVAELLPKLKNSLFKPSSIRFDTSTLPYVTKTVKTTIRKLLTVRSIVRDETNWQKEFMGITLPTTTDFTSCRKPANMAVWIDRMLKCYEPTSAPTNKYLLPTTLSDWIFPEPHHRLGQTSKISWGYFVMHHTSDTVFDLEEVVEKVKIKDAISSPDHVLNDKVNAILDNISGYRDLNRDKVIENLSDVLLWWKNRRNKLFWVYRDQNYAFFEIMGDPEDFLRLFINFVVDVNPDMVLTHGFFSTRGKTWQKFVHKLSSLIGDRIYMDEETFISRCEQRVKYLTDRKVLTKPYITPSGKYEGKALMFENELEFLGDAWGLIAPWEVFK